MHKTKTTKPNQETQQPSNNGVCARVCGGQGMNLTVIPSMSSRHCQMIMSFIGLELGH